MFSKVTLNKYFVQLQQDTKVLKITSQQFVHPSNALYLFISMTKSQATWSFYYLIINFVHMLKVTCSYTGSLDVPTLELFLQF